MWFNKTFIKIRRHIFQTGMRFRNSSTMTIIYIIFIVYGEISITSNICIANQWIILQKLTLSCISYSNFLLVHEMEPPLKKITLFPKIYNYFCTIHTLITTIIQQKKNGKKIVRFQKNLKSHVTKNLKKLFS